MCTCILEKILLHSNRISRTSLSSILYKWNLGFRSKQINNALLSVCSAQLEPHTVDIKVSTSTQSTSVYITAPQTKWFAIDFMKFLSTNLQM